MKEAKKGGIARFCLTAAIAFAVVVGTVFAVNSSVDPAELVHPNAAAETADSMVELISSGHGAVGVDGFDERLVKRECVFVLPRHETIVLGSSRGALISSDMTADESFFNFSVTGASLYDIVGLYGLLWKQDKLPQRVIISVDPWWFNDNYDSNRFDGQLSDGYYSYATERMGYTDVSEEYLSLRPEFSDFSYRYDEKLDLMELTSDKRSELFSIAYFQSSMRKLFGDGYGIERWDDYLSDEAMLMRRDGSICYPASFRNAGISSVNAQVASWLPDNVLGCEDFGEGEQRTRKLFRDFLESVREDGTEVLIVISPLHPTIYAHMLSNDRYASAIASETFVREAADELGLKVVGSLDPSKTGAGEGDFYDACHYRFERIGELVSELCGEDKER